MSLPTLSRGPAPRPGPRRTAGPGIWVLVALACVAGCVIAGVAITAGPDRRGAGPSDAEAAAEVLPVEYWQQRFDSGADELYERSLDESRSADSWDYYDLAYGIDAFTAMFQATGDPKYLDSALELVTNMVDDARVSSSLETSQFRDNYLGWVSEREDVRGEEVPLFESYNWRYVTRMLRVMRQTPAVYDDPRYRADYERLLDFTEVNIFEKWYARGAGEHIFRNRTHMAAHWAYIAVDLLQLSADDSRRARYLEVVNGVNRDLPNGDSSLRDQLQLTDGDPPAYFWSDQWGEDDPPGQDVSHGNGDVAYIVEAHDLGVEWTRTDIDRLSGTLTGAILRDDGEFAEYVDGSGEGSGGIADGFVKLGRYHPAVQVDLQQHDVQNAHYSANMALNARLLAAG